MPIFGHCRISSSMLRNLLQQRRQEATRGFEMGRPLAGIDLHRHYPAALSVFRGAIRITLLPAFPRPITRRASSSDSVYPRTDFLRQRRAIPGELQAYRASQAGPALDARDLGLAHAPRHGTLVLDWSSLPSTLIQAAGADLLTKPTSPPGRFSHIDPAAHEWEGLEVDWLKGQCVLVLSRSRGLRTAGTGRPTCRGEASR